MEMVDYYPLNNTSSIYRDDKDDMETLLRIEKDYVNERAKRGASLTLSELLKRLDIQQDKYPAKHLFVKDLIWFNSYEGWFVGAFLERSP